MSALVLLALSPASAAETVVDGSKDTFIPQKACFLDDDLTDEERERCLLGMEEKVELDSGRSVEFCTENRYASGCGPTRFGDTSSTENDWEPLRPGMYEVGNGWVMGLGGHLATGMAVFAEDPEAVARAVELGDIDGVTVAVQVSNPLHTDGVEFGIVDEGAFGQFIVARDRSNAAGGSFPLDGPTNLAVFDNFDPEVRAARSGF